jgi:hypothetical protein
LRFLANVDSRAHVGPRFAVGSRERGVVRECDSADGGTRAAVGIASRIRRAMSWSVTTARTTSLPPQRAQALMSLSNVRARKVAHGTFELAAKSRPPPNAA